MQRFDNEQIVHIPGVDHPESLSVGPRGELYTTGTGCQVYRVDVATNRAEQFATTANRCLGQAVDAAGNLYCAETGLGAVVKVMPDGKIATYATGPEGRPFACANYPAFDRGGALYLSDSGDWSGAVNGGLYKIDPGGGAARLWYPEAIDTPNAIALDAAERYLYLVETFGAAIARVVINGDLPVSRPRDGSGRVRACGPPAAPRARRHCLRRQRPAVDRLPPPGRYLVPVRKPASC